MASVASYASITQGQPEQAQFGGDGSGGGSPYYGYAQGWYAPPPQDTNAYYGVYSRAGGYGGYQQPQQ